MFHVKLDQFSTESTHTFRMVSTLLYSRLVTMFLILHNILNQSIGQRANLQRGQQSSAGYFIDHANHYLDVPEIDSKQVINMMHCLQQCIRHQRCFSTNVAVNPNQNGRLTCQLLSTDKYNASMSFKRRKFFHHFSLVVRHFYIF